MYLVHCICNLVSKLWEAFGKYIANGFGGLDSSFCDGWNAFYSWKFLGECAFLVKGFERFYVCCITSSSAGETFWNVL
jgi:hypothetical protein